MSVPASALDCLACGVCCRTGADGTILVPAEDLIRWKKLGRQDLLDALQPGHFGEKAFATDDTGACVHLGCDAGSADGNNAARSLTPKEAANACRIYEVRGTTCREFKSGSPQCLEFRREFGIDPPKTT